ncbi:MAG: hypothetical protein PHG48_08230 [Eubacteriales bacterium]|nr:hypothetical protein [Eubacteriales bacterium]
MQTLTVVIQVLASGHGEPDCPEGLKNLNSLTGGPFLLSGV